jgi:hypothetical protein
VTGKGGTVIKSTGESVISGKLKDSILKLSAGGVIHLKARALDSNEVTLKLAKSNSQQVGTNEVCSNGRKSSGQQTTFSSVTLTLPLSKHDILCIEIPDTEIVSTIAIKSKLVISRIFLNGYLNSNTYLML